MRKPDVLAVFVKAPVVSMVKTRLTAEIGAVRAAALYRRLGRQAVGNVVSKDYKTVVWYAPHRYGRLVRAWLEGLGVSRFRLQARGDLGNRLLAALATHNREGAGRVLLIGSDCPGIDNELIAKAFAVLEDRDVVLGPAWDGGYYLIGVKTLRASLFRGISWSSSEVARETKARACAAGLSCGILPTLRDVDTMADAQAVGLNAEPERMAVGLIKLKHCCRETITRHVVAIATLVEGTRLQCPSCGSRLVYEVESGALPRWRVEGNGRPTS